MDIDELLLDITSLTELIRTYEYKVYVLKNALKHLRTLRDINDELSKEPNSCVE